MLADPAVKVMSKNPRTEVVGCDGFEGVNVIGLERVTDSAGRKL